MNDRDLYNKLLTLQATLDDDLKKYENLIEIKSQELDWLQRERSRKNQARHQARDLRESIKNGVMEGDNT